MKKMPDGSHLLYGYWKGRMWFPNEYIANIPGAFNVSRPGRAYPCTYLRHFYTTKFWKLFEKEYPKEAEELIIKTMKKLLVGRRLFRYES